LLARPVSLLAPAALSRFTRCGTLRTLALILYFEERRFANTGLLLFRLGLFARPCGIVPLLTSFFATAAIFLVNIEFALFFGLAPDRFIGPFAVKFIVFVLALIALGCFFNY
jgi:hypothetical protein